MTVHTDLQYFISKKALEKMSSTAQKLASPCWGMRVKSTRNTWPGYHAVPDLLSWCDNEPMLLCLHDVPL